MWPPENSAYFPKIKHMYVIPSVEIGVQPKCHGELVIITLFLTLLRYSLWNWRLLLKISGYAKAESELNIYSVKAVVF